MLAAQHRHVLILFVSVRPPSIRGTSCTCRGWACSETGLYTSPTPMEESQRTLLMGGGLLYITGAEAENSAVKFSKKISTTTVKISLPLAQRKPQGQTSAEWKNAMKLGICSCNASGEKSREICREKFWALSSFVSSGKRNGKISPEISRNFSRRIPRAVSGEIFMAALLQGLQRRQAQTI